jgi:hypothetical protein
MVPKGKAQKQRSAVIISTKVDKGEIIRKDIPTVFHCSVFTHLMMY